MNITIIVPIYNAGAFLDETLGSIISQTFANWTCLLINDGSTDNSQEIIKEYCNKDSRFISYHKKNEKSANLARLYGLQKVQDDYVINIDADDYIEPEYLEKLIFRQKETGADCVTGTMVGCIEELKGEGYTVPMYGFDYEQVISGKEAFRMTIGNWGIPGCNGTLYKKDLYLKAQFGKHINSDELTCRQILFHSEKVAFCKARYLYRNNIGTSSVFSANSFSRANVDYDIEQFIYNNYAKESEIKKIIARQRLFNLIYLCGDFQLNMRLFSPVEQEEINSIIKNNYHTVRRKKTFEALPLHSTFLGPCYGWFKICCLIYAKYKKNSGKEYFYK